MLVASVQASTGVEVGVALADAVGVGPVVGEEDGVAVGSAVAGGGEVAASSVGIATDGVGVSPGMGVAGAVAVAAGLTVGDGDGATLTHALSSTSRTATTAHLRAVRRSPTVVDMLMTSCRSSRLAQCIDGAFDTSSQSGQRVDGPQLR
jgi:hypothetical protein